MVKFGLRKKWLREREEEGSAAARWEREEGVIFVFIF
jgi:hypothetical protein